MLQHFYHQTIRKVVVAFGALFNDIYISRLDDNNAEVERIKVPIGYGPQQKFIRRLARIGTDFDANKVRIENYLPRLSFELLNVSYDPNRKLNPMNRTVLYKNSSTVKSRYEKVPYNMDLSLGIMTKNTEDALQIIEQILPYFQPEYTVSIKMNDIDQNVNVPIVFKNCNIGEGDDGSYGNYDLRKLTYANLVFTAKLYLYGPINDAGVITDTGGVTIGGGGAGASSVSGSLSGINIMIGIPNGPTAANIRVYPNTGVTAGSYVPEGPTAQQQITEFPGNS